MGYFTSCQLVARDCIHYGSSQRLASIALPISAPSLFRRGCSGRGSAPALASTTAQPMPLVRSPKETFPPWRRSGPSLLALGGGNITDHIVCSIS
jgi:hypothetical protein